MKARTSERSADPAPLSSALVEKFKLDISQEECQQLTTKYDLKANGRFAYCDFIQSCVLLLKAKETSLMQRLRIQNANKMVGEPSPRAAWGGQGLGSFSVHHRRGSSRVLPQAQGCRGFGGAAGA